MVTSRPGHACVPLFLDEAIDLPTVLAGLLVVSSVALTRVAWMPGRG